MKPMLFFVALLARVWILAQGQDELKDDGVENQVVDTSTGLNEEQTTSEKLVHKGFTASSSADTDSIQILDLPKYSTPVIRPNIRYSITGRRILVLDVFAAGLHRTKSIYHTEWTDVADLQEPKSKIVKIVIPDQLIYKEDITMNIHPDLHTEYLLVRASLVDYDNPMMLLQHTEQSLKLVPPWRRMEKNSYCCCSWKGMILKKLTESTIPKCPKADDVVDLLLFPVALISSEHGYKKFFEKLHLPEEAFMDQSNVNLNSPQFTLATWLYLMKGCSNDMCPLMYHIKGDDYRSPLIGLLRSGHLHIQLHYQDGGGYAFLIDAQLPLHQWVHIAVTFRGTVVTLYIRHGKNLQHSKVFVHSEFPAGVFHYNDTDGHWGSGGSRGFASAKGFIGPARIYRRRALSKDTIENVFTPKSVLNLAIQKYFKYCHRLKSRVNFFLKKERKERNSCAAWRWSDNTSKHCHPGIDGSASEIVKIQEIWQNGTTLVSSVQNNVYNSALKLIKSDKKNVRDALNLLSYGSCLGHTPSMYLTSVIYATGLGIPADPVKSQRSLLIGALYNHPLSQMSLAYKHLIGADGFPEDHDVSQTYYRYAAEQSNKLLVEHNEVDTHGEAVRLDKKEDLDNYRGPNSNWFHWLKHQAKQGVTDAQSIMGEVFYYGARGFRRNLTRAAQFYEMGANRGDAQMLFNLGVVKLRGQGVAVNEDEARELLQKSAELGFAAAFNALGYYELNIRQNKSGAAHYFKYAAEKGDRDGLYNLGYAYENGLAPGSTPDLKLAMPYYIDAASKGHPGGCIVAGDAFSKGNHVDRNTHLGIIYFKFVADQIPEMGMHLRHGLDEYFAEDWYGSLLYYLLAAEAGMEVAQYNVALLCEWDWGRVSRHTSVDCAWRYYNHSAELHWVPSMIKVGDNYWYGIATKKNITAAVQLYSKAASKERNPQAIYNLGYLIEHNYPLDGLTWLDFHPSSHDRGNLSLAAMFYTQCRDSSDEALVPCSLGLLRVAVKMAWQLHLTNNEMLLVTSLAFAIALGVLLCICRFHSRNEIIDVV